MKSITLCYWIKIIFLVLAVSLLHACETGELVRTQQADHSDRSPGAENAYRYISSIDSTADDIVDDAFSREEFQEALLRVISDPTEQARYKARALTLVRQGHYSSSELARATRNCLVAPASNVRRESTLTYAYLVSEEALAVMVIQLHDPVYHVQYAALQSIKSFDTPEAKFILSLWETRIDTFPDYREHFQTILGDAK